MKALTLSAIAVVIVAVGTVAAIEYPSGKLTIKVLGDDQRPVLAADVGIGFQVMSKKYFGNEEIEVRGLTNAEGEFSGEARGDRNIGFTVRKAGYYPTTGKYDFERDVADKWQPWNPTIEVVLKKIGTPAAMYARNVRLEVPGLDAPIGFDLEVSDWVAPYGKGAVADFVFTLNRKWVDKKNFAVQLMLTFSNSGDGIQAVEESLQYGSELKLPRTAPEQGYEPQLITSIGRVPGKPIQNEARENRSYIYRVRTVLNKNAEVASAMYGKIRGDIRLDPINSKTSAIKFTYYLNPDGTRNLEFDPKQSLLDGLKEADRVNDP